VIFWIRNLHKIKGNSCKETINENKKGELKMGLFDRFSGGSKEDPTIYTNELKQLREQLRANRGVLKCSSCGRNMNIDLKTIEREIRENRKMASGGLFGAGTLINFVPDWNKGSVCKGCLGVLCGSCTQKALEDSGGPEIGMPCCPKCGKVVVGIDHITD
jgi:hypothetical protein